MALLLERKGITRVHPLEGGLAAWMALNFPVQALELPVAAGGPGPGNVPSSAV